MKIDKENKRIVVKNIETEEIFYDTYDKLVLATGATVFVPNIEGNDRENVFFLRNVQNAVAIKEYIINNKPNRAIIAGSGFIGLEVLENLVHQKIDVTLIEAAERIAPNLDKDMSVILENKLIELGIKIIKSNTISKIIENSVISANNESIDADMIFFATGVRPNIKLAQDAGIDIGETGAIYVNEKMETNIKDIYACGDCIETFSLITGKSVFRTLGSTANKTGRIAGDVLTGGNLRYRGNLGTGIFRIFDFTVAATGLSEREAIEEGYEIQISHNTKHDKPSYFNGEEMIIKAIADKNTKRLLGVQIIGKSGVDKRIDVFVTLIMYRATVDELFDLDLAYAPPFSTSKDPVHYAGMILENAINNRRKLMTVCEVCSAGESLQIIDARSTEDFLNKGHLTGAVNIPHAEIREKLGELDSKKTTLAYCNICVTGNAVQNILINHGFKKVYNLSGGHKFYEASKQKNDGKEFGI